MSCATGSPISTRAYQGAKGGVEPALLLALEKVAIGDVTPDLTFVLDLPPELGMERARRRRGEGRADRFEAEDLAFHAALRQKFLDIARAEPDRCHVIDAAQPPEKVADAIWAACLQRLFAEAAGGKKWA